MSISFLKLTIHIGHRRVRRRGRGEVHARRECDYLEVDVLGRHQIENARPNIWRDRHPDENLSVARHQSGIPKCDRPEPEAVREEERKMWTHLWNLCGHRLIVRGCSHGCWVACGLGHRSIKFSFQRIWMEHAAQGPRIGFV